LPFNTPNIKVTSRLRVQPRSETPGYYAYDHRYVRSTRCRTSYSRCIISCSHR